MKNIPLDKIENKLKRRKHLAWLINKKGIKRGVEIGVARGKFSRFLLDNSKLDILYSIDPWASEDKEKATEVFQEATERLAPLGDRSCIMRMPSLEGAKAFKDESLGFIYIDADHSYKGITSDIAAWWPKVKPGGIFSGHDYKNMRRSSSRFVCPGLDTAGPAKVKQAVQEFIKREELRLILTKPPISWLVIKPGRGDDAS
tara:strand:+ start:925 stop:1527 length:603 start_codon:yes stop_codon:yes gene_type:complete